ncbi:MAG: TetR/AcrR family transcriptional regulator [Solirubrobacterales bacterium]
MLATIGSEGYTDASVQDALERAGAYRQAFYDNFTDKLDCYLQAYDASVEEIEAAILVAAAGTTSWRGGLRAGLGAVLTYLDAEPDIGRALIVEVHAAGREATRRRDAVVRRFGSYLRRASSRDNGEAAPTIAPEAVAAGIHSVLHSRLANREDGGLRELLPEFMYIAVLPYFGVDAARSELENGS